MNTATNIPAIEVPDESLVSTNTLITTTISSDKYTNIIKDLKSMRKSLKVEIDQDIQNHPLIIVIIVLLAVILFAIVVYFIYKMRFKLRVCVGKEKLEIDLEPCNENSDKPKSQSDQSRVFRTTTKLNQLLNQAELGQMSNKQRQNLTKQWGLLDEIVNEHIEQQSSKKLTAKHKPSRSLVKSASADVEINKLRYRKNNLFQCVEPNCKFESTFDSIKSHAKSHFNLKKAKYSCRVCRFTCNRETTLHQHMIKCHEYLFKNIIDIKRTK